MYVSSTAKPCDPGMHLPILPGENGLSDHLHRGYSEIVIRIEDPDYGGEVKGDLEPGSR